jgi:hypothetical protein
MSWITSVATLITVAIIL